MIVGSKILPEKGKKLTQSYLICRRCTLHYPDQLSNFRIIPDYLKVVDFIGETVGLSEHPIKISENDVFLYEQ